MSDINAILDRHGIKRCGDSSCIFGPRGGMMTNGGCRCGHDDPGAPSRPTRLSRQLAHAVTEQAAEIARLTAELAKAREVTAGVCRYLDCAASDLLAVVTSLYETRARAISDATDARGTVGGLLATAPVGAIVEWYDADFRRWYQAQRHPGRVHGRPYGKHGWRPEWATSYDVSGDLHWPARLVPAAEADADPNQRGPLPTAAPRCSCTHEAGDSRCDAHPTCSECGDSTARNVDDCADHCQVCASLRRGHAITDWTAGCSACKSRGPLPKGG